MITSVTEILEVLNFGDMTNSAIKKLKDWEIMYQNVIFVCVS